MSTSTHEPEPVDLGAIDVALKRLWKPPGNGPPPQQTNVRACMANLLVYCASGCEADAITEELDVILRVQPSRVLLLVAGEPAPVDGVAATVSARCHLGGDGHHFCSEQITLTAPPDAADRLAFTARPLLIGDLPTSLWWLSEDPPSLHGPVFSELRAATDQIIYSSDRWPNPARGTIAVARSAAGHPTLTDLAWRRLEPWRRLASQTLEPLAPTGALRRIDRIRVEHGREGVSQAWLLTGWLASRLRWRSPGVAGVNSRETVWSFRADDRAVRAQIRQVPDTAGGLQRIVIHWDGGSEPSAVAFSRTGDGRLSAEVPTLGEEPRTIVLPPESRAALVAAEVQDLVPDPVFRGALEVSLAMAESVVA